MKQSQYETALKVYRSYCSFKTWNPDAPLFHIWLGKRLEQTNHKKASLTPEQFDAGKIVRVKGQWVGTT